MWQKVPKNHCACGGDLTNIVFVRLPLPLADRAPARTPASLPSNMRALLARSAARLRHRQRRRLSLHPRPSMACVVADCRITGQDDRQRSRLFSAPLHDAAAHSRTAGQAPHVRGQGWPSSARLPFGEHQGQWSRHDVGETVMPGAMVFGDFLPKQKVTRSPLRRAKQKYGAACATTSERVPSPGPADHPLPRGEGKRHATHGLAIELRTTLPKGEENKHQRQAFEMG